jgi:FtsP/CotA-like multicopper oxidase with cupredoxin domain
MVQPGESYNYEYNLAMQPAGTLSWFHPHVHGLVAEQVWGGFAGVLVTEDENDSLAGYETHIMEIRDISLTGSALSPHIGMMDYMMGKQGNLFLINGQVNPVLSMKPGQVQRWRIVNQAPARFFRLGLEGQPVNLIGTDGGLLDKPYPLQDILIAPGERVDLLVQAPLTPGTYRFLSLPYSRGGMMTGTSGTRSILTVSVDGTPVNDAIPVSINPAAQRLAPDTSTLPHRSLTLSMMMGRGLINGQDYDVNPYTINSQVGTYEIWEIYNPTMMDHPFHQHVNEAQVISIEGGAPGYAALYSSIPAWKDTVIVPRGGKVTLLIPVKDFTGMGMFHCHILEHEDIGMMGIWNIGDGSTAPMKM